MAGEEPDRLTFIRRLPCAADGMGPCWGPMDPHHAGRHGTGKRAHDDTAIPLCRGHHQQIGGGIGGYGVFQAMGKAGRRAWQDARIEETRRAYEAHIMDPWCPS